MINPSSFHPAHRPVTGKYGKVIDGVAIFIDIPSERYEEDGVADQGAS